MSHPLEQYRTKKNLTYQALAAEIGASRTQAFAWCKGVALPRPEFADKIEAATGVTYQRIYRAYRDGGETRAA